MSHIDTNVIVEEEQVFTGGQEGSSAYKFSPAGSVFSAGLHNKFQGFIQRLATPVYNLSSQIADR